MKFNLFSLFFLLTPFALTSQESKKASVNNPIPVYFEYNDDGRLGDHLLGYIKAKWICYKNNLPLSVKPFTYFDQLKISDIDKGLEKLPEKIKTIPVNSLEATLNEKDSTYVVSYYLPILTPLDFEKIQTDKIFVNELKKLIAPKASLDLIKPPKDQLSVAVHIRKGGGFDLPLKSVQIFDLKEAHVNVKSKEYVDKHHPLKFPPEQYYIDQIKRLSKIFNDKPLYLFIFTDDSEPEKLCQRIKKHVNLDNITYDYRKNSCNHDKNVLEDFFSMTHFDCLIRSGDSNFSKIIELLSNYKLVIYPKGYHWTKEKKKKFLIMDDIQTKFNH